MKGGTRDGEAPRVGRILFCSYHCYLDPSSGAAISMRDLLHILRQRGWGAEVFTGPLLDYEQPRDLQDHLRALGFAVTSARCDAGPMPFEVFRTHQDDMPVLLYRPAVVHAPPEVQEGYTFVAMVDRVFRSNPPDIVLVYGGSWMGRAIISCAKAHGIPTVFWLRNCNYMQPGFFSPVDAVLVPSEFLRQYYRQSLGIECIAIPSPVDFERVRCGQVDGQYVTFVNPQPAKGVYVFARIAMELSRTRRDIRLLVVEGRGGSSWLQATGLDLSTMPNLRVMPNTPDPREFLRLSRMILMPSLWPEAFSRIPVEAFVSGIPVLASRRGGLPENLAEAGFLVDIPAKYTEHTRVIPSADEVDEWIRLIIRLWDSDAVHRAESQRCLAAAQAFSPAAIGPRYEQVFRTLLTARASADTSASGSVMSVFSTYLPGGGRAHELTDDLLDGLLGRHRMEEP